jgi:hypothetical protein
VHYPLSLSYTSIEECDMQKGIEPISFAAIILVMLISGCPGPVNPPDGGNESIYIADALNQRLVKMSDMSGNGWQELSKLFPGSNLPLLPISITFHGGYVWIFDAWNYKVLRMDDLS